MWEVAGGIIIALALLGLLKGGKHLFWMSESSGDHLWGVLLMVLAVAGMGLVLFLGLLQS